MVHPTLPCECVHRTKPEVYRAPEVFKELTVTSWKKMVDQSGKRQYHSVASLLPDGRVFSAGGTATADRHTVELFSPTYFFAGTRPQIDTSFTTAVSYDDPASIAVTMRGTGANPTIKRVALIRNSATTHAVDMSQRYVELTITNLPTQIPGTNQWSVPFDWPEDGYFAPPGWYMLTVVADMDRPAQIADASNLPSPAKWIYLQ